MASMRDVARQAGVSVSTVSRVLSRKIPVDKQTREKVLTVIEELSYRPNLIAAGLRSKSGRSIGLLVPRIADPFFMELIDHLDRSVVSHGFNLLLFNTRSDPEFEEQVVDNLLRRHVDGIIFSLVSDESRVPSLVNGVDVPIVMLDRVRNDARLMSLVLDNHRAGQLAAEHLLGLGHRRLACVTGPKRIHLCRDRLGGFADTLAQQGVPLDAQHVIEGDFTLGSGRAAAELLLEMRPRPTAVWAQNDLMAAGLLKGALRRGLRVPRDISIVGMDDVQIPEVVQPSLTSVAQPLREMAERAVEMILSTKESRDVPREVLLQPRLNVRESSGVAPDDTEE